MAEIALKEFAEIAGRSTNAVAVAYLRGAEAALKSAPPDAKVALQLLQQALASLDPKGGDHG